MIQSVREGAAGDAVLVAAALAGDDQAFASLFDGWFDRCFDVAYRIVRNRDIAAEVAQEVFLGAWRDLASLRDHDAFGGWILRTSRNRALNRLEKEQRSVALGDDATTRAVDAAASAPDASADALAGTGADLVWAAAAALGERDASILDLHLRHGLAAGELAEALDVTPNNASQMLFRLRAKLGDAIRSFVLWHQGAPACPELQDDLHRAGLGSFGPEAARVAQRHARTCERCDERQRLTLAPEALFAGVPLVAAGPELRAKVISSLRDAGVPADGRPALLPDDPEGTTAVVPVPGADDRAGRDRRAGRRAALVSAVLAALLLAGAATLLLRREGPTERIDRIDTSGLATPASDPAASTTLGADPSTPPTSAPPGSTAPTSTASTASTAGPMTTTARPTVRSTTTVPGPTSTTAAPPVVQRFAATPVTSARACSPDQRPVQLAWSTAGATSVTLLGPGAPGGAQPPDGSATACAPTGAATYVLTATGPGGAATAKDTA